MVDVSVSTTRADDNALSSRATARRGLSYLIPETSMLPFPQASKFTNPKHLFVVRRNSYSVLDPGATPSLPCLSCSLIPGSSRA